MIVSDPPRHPQRLWSHWAPARQARLHARAVLRVLRRQDYRMVGAVGTQELLSPCPLHTDLGLGSHDDSPMHNVENSLIHTGSALAI